MSRLFVFVGLLLVASFILSGVVGQWPGPPYPKTVGAGSDNCTAYPCEGSVGFANASTRVSPYYPQQFTNHISGVLVMPFTITNLSEPHILLAQEATFFYDYPNDILKFDNNLKEVINFTNSFIHTGDRMFADEGVCFCTNIGIGILRYNAFADAEYLGREEKFIEYIWENRTCDHYLKGPHHIWFDVETKYPLRAYQPTNGLQVYTQWNLSVNPIEIPKYCIKDNCTDGFNVEGGFISASPRHSKIDLPIHLHEGESKEEKIKSCPFHQMKKSIPSKHDWRRAETKIPREQFLAKRFEEMSETLNHELKKEKGLKLEDCRKFHPKELNDLLRIIRKASNSDFQQLYAGKEDRRRFLFESMEEQEQFWSQELSILESLSHLSNVTRDGKCHEAVMWYTHHLTEEAKQFVNQFITLPLLPTWRHEVPKRIQNKKEDVVYGTYSAQIACTACHLA